MSCCSHLKPAGLTGGIASGKTTVAAMFAKCGALTINTDVIAADVLQSGSPALTALVNEFGDRILDTAGALDRRTMLDILLSDSTALQKQLDILQPYLLPAIDRTVQNAMKSEPGRVVIVEAPLLFEYGKPERYDPIIVVSIPRHLQVTRLMKRSGKDKTWASAVVDLQWPLFEKEKHADYIIYNDSSPEETVLQVQRVYAELLKRFIR